MRGKRPAGTVGFGELTAIAAAVCVFGIAFGVIGRDYGLSPVSAVAMSMLVSSGASQIAAVSIAAEGGSLTAALLSGWLIASRFTLLGVSVSRRLQLGWTTNVLAAQLLIDASAAAAVRSGSPRVARMDFWRVGGVVYGAWITGTVLGVWLGGRVPQPEDWGMDVALPAVLLALIGPQLRERGGLAAACCGVLIALGSLPFAPAGVPVVAAGLGGLAGTFIAHDRRRGGVK